MKEELERAKSVQQFNAANKHDEALKILTEDSAGQTYQVVVVVR